MLLWLPRKVPNSFYTYAYFVYFVITDGIKVVLSSLHIHYARRSVSIVSTSPGILHNGTPAYQSTRICSQSQVSASRIAISRHQVTPGVHIVIQGRVLTNRHHPPIPSIL